VLHGNLGARAKVCGAHLWPNQRQSLTPRCVQSPHPTLYALHKISRKPEVPYGESYMPRPYGDPTRTLRTKRREAVRLLVMFGTGVEESRKAFESRFHAEEQWVCFAHSEFHTDWVRQASTRVSSWRISNVKRILISSGCQDRLPCCSYVCQPVSTTCGI
jgi:hypothetical protein